MSITVEASTYTESHYVPATLHPWDSDGPQDVIVYGVDDAAGGRRVRIVRDDTAAEIDLTVDEARQIAMALLATTTELGDLA